MHPGTVCMQASILYVHALGSTTIKYNCMYMANAKEYLAYVPSANNTVFLLIINTLDDVLMP